MVDWCLSLIVVGFFVFICMNVVVRFFRIFLFFFWVLNMLKICFRRVWLVKIFLNIFMYNDCFYSVVFMFKRWVKILRVLLFFFGRMDRC